jgi:putative hydrolase of the HAD superfamily
MSRKPFPKGILFDMDGVLLIRTQSSEKTWQQVCLQFAPLLDLSPQRLEEVLRESRHTYRRSLEHDPEKQRRDRLAPFETRQEVVEKALKQVERPERALASEMVRTYETMSESSRLLAPYARETLQMLRDRAFPLALISNGNATYQRRKIKEHHLGPFFDLILIEEEFGLAKPDPRIFQAALDKLSLTAQETWMIGDDLAFDIAGSQRLGMLAIWVDHAGRGLPEENSIRPDQTIRTFLELHDLLGLKDKKAFPSKRFSSSLHATRLALQRLFLLCSHLNEQGTHLLI